MMNLEVDYTEVTDKEKTEKIFNKGKLTNYCEMYHENTV